ncbi:transposase [Planomonospora sphaerica]|uniref:Transposase n=1 Tax=Planomonospora sphaerica TaxID=161355 RepID=A0A161MF45_9ACTN|nr:transposase [Planomonospora sphaerica]
MDRLGRLCERIEPLLRKTERRQHHPGRKRLDDRKALCGIPFVLYTAIPWEFLPQELGFGSGMTCRRRLRDRHHAGVWERLHRFLLAEPHAADRLEQTIALPHWFRRLRIRWELRDDIHEAFMTPAASIICRRRLNR